MIHKSDSFKGKIGDYVLAINFDPTYKQEDAPVATDFIRNNIGLVIGNNADIIDVQYDTNDKKLINTILNEVFGKDYYGTEKLIGEGFFIMYIRYTEIAIWGDNKEELEMVLSTIKYNL